MNSVANPSSLPARDRQRHALLACLLFAAQLFSQLHVLQHLEYLDHDEAQNEICVLCILGAATDHASVDSTALPVGLTGSPQLAYLGHEGSIPRSPIGYRGRAPPPTSSIA